MKKDKNQLLTNLKENLQKKLITPEELLIILSETRCYFCQNPVAEAEFYHCSFWNQVAKDKRLICYICLRYSYKRNLPLISEPKKELFVEYEKQGIFKK